MSIYWTRKHALKDVILSNYCFFPFKNHWFSFFSLVSSQNSVAQTHHHSHEHHSFAWWLSTLNFNYFQDLPLTFHQTFFIKSPPAYFSMSSSRRINVSTLSVCISQLLTEAMYEVKRYSKQQSSSRSNSITNAYLDKQIFSCQTYRKYYLVNDNNCYVCFLSSLERAYNSSFLFLCWLVL